MSSIPDFVAPTNSRRSKRGADPARADVVDDSTNYDALACAADLVDALPLVMSSLRAGMRRNIADGLSVPQFRCLAFISRQPGASVTDITGFLGVTMATTSAMVDRLAMAGYVTVEVSPEDRRRSVIKVSDSGADLLARMRAGGKAELANRLAILSKSELITMRKAAALLHRSFQRG
ncbi:hypothetical protein BH09PSE5_BH09PSE5_05950 [soil metagenome]